MFKVLSNPANVLPQRSLSRLFRQRRSISMASIRPHSADGHASSPEAKRRRIEPVMQITLTETEKAVRNVLLAVVDDINAKGFRSAAIAKADEPLTLRISGGWVRDKILGRDSKDIDIAINRMSGAEYTSFLTDYLAAHAGEPGIPHIRSVYKVERNPEKGKHLETATTKVFDMDIDFVNLRGTSYAAEGNPVAGSGGTEIGTAQEDALRRDATVNALFFNLNTEKVEDFTDHGIKDLEKGILRTPLQPSETFHDDPLRVVRLIRFAANYNFSIAKEVEDEISTEKIRDIVRHGVSRERVGSEVDKMLSAPDPFVALSAIHRLGLYDAIFAIPSLPNVPTSLDPSKMLHAGRLLQHLQSSSALTQLRATFEDNCIMAWKAACLLPWHGFTLPNDKTLKKLSAPANAVLLGLVGKGNDVDMIQAAEKLYENLKGVAEKNDEKAMTRRELGMAVRRWGPTWTFTVLNSAMLDAVRVWQDEGYDPKSNLLEDLWISKTTLPVYEKLLQSAEDLGVADAYEKKKAVLDGKEVCNILGVKPGPWMKDAVEELIGWELEHPEKGRDEAVEYVKEVIAKTYEGKFKK